jgi:hypothetical protein
MTNKLIKAIFKWRLNELVSDGASNWGGWQSGFPGSGSPNTGMTKTKGEDVGALPKVKTNTLRSGADDLIKLDGSKTDVIVSPTLNQAATGV